MLHLLPVAGVHLFSRNAQTGDAGYIFRAGAQVALLAAAVDQGADLHPLVDVEKTHALGTVNLVGADGEQVDHGLFGADHELSVGLDGVHVKQGGGVLPADQGADVLHRLHCADLIVHVHDGDQDGVRPDGLLQLLKGNVAVAVHGQVGHLKSLFLQKCQRIVHAGVLDPGADDVLSGPVVGHGRADQGHVVALRAAGGEQNLLLFHLQGLCHLGRGLAHVLLRLHALAVLGGGVAVILCHRLHHDVLHAVKDPGGGGIVKICFHFHLLLLYETCTGPAPALRFRLPAAASAPPARPGPQSRF